APNGGPSPRRSATRRTNVPATSPSRPPSRENTAASYEMWQQNAQASPPPCEPTAPNWKPSSERTGPPNSAKHSAPASKWNGPACSNGASPSAATCSHSPDDSRRPRCRSGPASTEWLGPEAGRSDERQLHPLLRALPARGPRGVHPHGDQLPHGLTLLLQRQPRLAFRAVPHRFRVSGVQKPLHQQRHPSGPLKPLLQLFDLG